MAAPRTRNRYKQAYNSDDESYTFPSELLDSAKQLEWDSPTKRQRTILAPRKVARRKELFRPSTVQETAPATPGHSDGCGRSDGGGEVDFGETSSPSAYKLLQAPIAPHVSTDALLEHYLEAVEAQVAGFYHLESNLFVVQGWDHDRRQATTHWYHLEFRRLAPLDELFVACTCPSATSQGNECIHQAFFKSYEVEELVDRSGQECNEFFSDPQPAILFLHRVLESGASLSILSVRSASRSFLTGRAIVTHFGESPSGGVWKCSKDSGILCSHITLAQSSLQAIGVHGGGFTAGVQPKGISHLPIHPPIWAAIGSDCQLYPPPPPYRALPEGYFALDARSSCPCPIKRTFFDLAAPTIQRPCKVYTLDSLHTHQIELQPCPACPPQRRRFIGPDLREIGLFNYNNLVIVSHQLLDEYTSAYTSSETPFTAWVTQVSRRYGLSNASFMGEDMFRSVWFSYVSIQEFNNDMSCYRCGLSPRTVIWDGITLAYSRKHVLSSLRPPTLTSDLSTIRGNTRYVSNQQLIPDAALRKQIRKALDPPSLEGLSEESKKAPEVQRLSESGLPAAPDEAKKAKEEAATRLLMARRAAQAQQYLEDLAATEAGIQAYCPQLAGLFHEHFGPQTFARNSRAQKVWRNLFLQLSAEESVLQFINHASLLGLQAFLVNPTTSNITQILSIPAVFRVLEKGVPIDSVLPVLHWLEERARSVLSLLLVEQAPLGSNVVEEEALDWKETGCLYSMPPLRVRPKYPKLRHDQQRETSKPKELERCGKYFLTYGERRLTGGIMVAWCSHSICYGFHCISESEGRDDVFAAMVTRWPKPPERVVYDFACALGPYCMTREPVFFANTYFAIDHFHSMGHTKCSPAAFLSEYANVDPRLVAINSSAAECGNGGLKRIRKSVSYMSQKRAIIYTKVFLSIWNRLKIRKMQKLPVF
ncbi:hypothetical protein BKA70DRAFT_1487785 [Coprinopsis sp. MPI-PUGE-AT-0042]|nr:hypothetical protein BKA70DRAFT_1487785 [Coprinopsis sp. MPI-PUGE-AT-0042]